jgi:hypothetical protein
MKHPALQTREEQIHIIFKTLSDAAKASEFVELSDLVGLITTIGNNMYSDDNDQLNCFKGDMFEVFAEGYFTLVKSKNSSGIINYEPLHGQGDDYGVDGFGTNYSNQPSVVQVKYRSNPKDLITYSALANTWHQAEEDDMVPESKKLWRRTMILFTNSYGANDNAVKRNKKYDRLFVINKPTIESEVNGNLIFWQDLYNLIKDSK